MVYKREYPMLGGRRLKPAFEPISEEPPTADELRWSDKLWNYMQEASPQETLAEQQGLSLQNAREQHERSNVAHLRAIADLKKQKLRLKEEISAH